jgi:prepilin-type N-terminal cleavage/methylation domain-containing protein
MGAAAGSNKGFSLVEMLVAVVIVAFTLLALSTVMVNSINVNFGNELRNTAMRLTSQTAEVLYLLPFESLQSCGITFDPDAHNYNASYTYDSSNVCLGSGTSYQLFPNPAQSLKGLRQKFNITWDVAVLSDNLRQITIAVAYRYREEHFTNSAVIYTHRKP